MEKTKRTARRYLALLLAFLLLLSAFGCARPEDPAETTDAPADTTDAPTDTTDAPEIQNPLVFEKATDLATLMTILPGYFHGEYDIEKGEYPKDILTMLFRFCYMYRKRLDFVEFDEATSILTIQGEGFRTLAKAMLGEDFDPMQCQIPAGSYAPDRDVYLVSAARDYWGGGWYAVEFGTELSVVETETNAIVTASVMEQSPYSGVRGEARLLRYTFRRVVADGLLCYRLLSVTDLGLSHPAPARYTYYVTDPDTFVPDGAKGPGKKITVDKGIVFMEFESEETMPALWYGRLLDAESFVFVNALFEEPEFPFAIEKTELIDILCTNRTSIFATVRFTGSGEARDVLYYSAATGVTTNEAGAATTKMDFQIWSASEAMEYNLVRAAFDPAAFAKANIPAETPLLFYLEMLGSCWFFVSTDNGADYAVYAYVYAEEKLEKVNPSVPDGLSYDRARPVLALTGEGGGGCRYILQAEKNGAVQYLNFGGYEGYFGYTGEVSEDEIAILKRLYPENFR